MRILRLFVRAAEANEAFVDFDFFSLREREFGFGGKFLDRKSVV